MARFPDCRPGHTPPVPAWRRTFLSHFDLASNPLTPPFLPPATLFHLNGFLPYVPGIVPWHLFFWKGIAMEKPLHERLVVSQPEDIRDSHRQASALSDVILGGQDGLVNVLGVILGVAAATRDPQIVLVAGLAATFAESVS